MNRRVLYALLLIAVCVLVMLFTPGSVSVWLLGWSLRVATSVALLGALVVGVVIGLLLK